MRWVSLPLLSQTTIVSSHEAVFTFRSASSTAASAETRRGMRKTPLAAPTTASVPTVSNQRRVGLGEQALSRRWIDRAREREHAVADRPDRPPQRPEGGDFFVQ